MICGLAIEIDHPRNGGICCVNCYTVCGGGAVCHSQLFTLRNEIIWHHLAGVNTQPPSACNDPELKTTVRASDLAYMISSLMLVCIYINTHYRSAGIICHSPFNE